MLENSRGRPVALFVALEQKEEARNNAAAGSAQVFFSIMLRSGTSTCFYALYGRRLLLHNRWLNSLRRVKQATENKEEERKTNDHWLITAATASGVGSTATTCSCQHLAGFSGSPALIPPGSRPRPRGCTDDALISSNNYQPAAIHTAIRAPTTTTVSPWQRDSITCFIMCAARPPTVFCRNATHWIIYMSWR